MVTPTNQARQVAAILEPEAFEAINAFGQEQNRKNAQVVRDAVDLAVRVWRADGDPEATAEAIRFANVERDGAVMRNFLTLMGDYVESVARRRPHDAVFLYDEASRVLGQRGMALADQLGASVSDIRADLHARAGGN